MKLQFTKTILQILLCLSVCFFYNSAYAQKVVVHYDDKNAVTTDLTKVALIRTFETDSATLPLLIFKEHFPNGQLSREGFVKKIYSTRFEGKMSTYNEKGIRLSVEFYDDGDLIGHAKYYYQNGELKKHVAYLKKEANDPKTTGYILILEQPEELISYYDSLGTVLVENGNGFVRYNKEKGEYEEGEYKDKFKTGIWKGVFNLDNDQISFTEEYKQGKIIKGTSIDKNGQNYSYTEKEKRPEYSKGLKAIYSFIDNNFRYTEEARKAGITGTIVTRFDIDTEGNLIEPRVTNDKGFGTSEEAIRIINKLKKWNPALTRGVPKRVTMILPMTIR